MSSRADQIVKFALMSINRRPKRLSWRPLTNIEINNYYKNNKYYGGCFSVHELGRKKLNGEQKFYILNLDEPDDQGTHWILLYLVDPTRAYYFDSFGMPGPDNVIEYMKRYRQDGFRNINQIQWIRSSACGYYCLYCCDRLLRGDSFVDIVQTFDSRSDIDRMKNEEVLYNYFIRKNKKI